MLKERLDVAKKAYVILNKHCNDFILESYLFGSTAKRCVNEDSDVDILIIGKYEKNLELINRISRLFETLEQDTNIEINVVYYNVDKFKELLKDGATFIRSIESSCIKLSEL